MMILFQLNNLNPQKLKDKVLLFLMMVLLLKLKDQVYLKQKEHQKLLSLITMIMMKVNLNLVNKVIKIQNPKVNLIHQRNKNLRKAILNNQLMRMKGSFI
jgi:hypothetical protein